MSIRTLMESISNDDTVIICDNYNSSSESLSIKAISFHRTERKEKYSSIEQTTPISTVILLELIGKCLSLGKNIYLTQI